MRPLTLSVLLESSQDAEEKQRRKALTRAETKRREDSEERVVGSMGIRGLTKKPSQPNAPDYDSEVRNRDINVLSYARNKLKTKQVPLGNGRTRPLDPGEEKETRRGVAAMKRKLPGGGVGVKK